MKNGNWVSLVWAAAGFAILSIWAEEWYGWIGVAILASWLIYVFWAYLKQ